MFTYWGNDNTRYEIQPQSLQISIFKTWCLNVSYKRKLILVWCIPSKGCATRDHLIISSYSALVQPQIELLIKSHSRLLSSWTGKIKITNNLDGFDMAILKLKWHNLPYTQSTDSNGLQYCAGLSQSMINWHQILVTWLTCRINSIIPNLIKEKHPDVYWSLDLLIWLQAPDSKRMSSIATLFPLISSNIKLNMPVGSSINASWNASPPLTSNKAKVFVSKTDVLLTSK